MKLKGQSALLPAMSEQTTNNETLRQYLIGSLPEAEAERLAELSVTDQAVAEALTAAEKDLIDAYVQGELEASEVEQFKSHYLASPLRREKVRFAEAFQIFAARSFAAEAVAIETATHDTQPKRAGWSPIVSFLTPRLTLQWRHWVLGAMTALMLLASGWLAIENLRLRQHASQAETRREELLQRERELQKAVEAERSTNAAAEQELARLRDERERLEQELAKTKSPGTVAPSPGEGTVFLLLTPPLRSSGQLPVLSLRRDPNLVSIQLQLEATNYSAYRVALVDPAGNQVPWRSGNLQPRTKGTDRVLAISFSTRLLKTQIYHMRVTGILAGRGSEIVSDYPFKVVK